MPAEVTEGKSRLLPPLPPAPPTHGLAPPPLPPAAFVEAAGRCANCLTPLVGPFCAQCGQHVADYHRSVWRFVVDFFDSAFCWDNKLFRTLGPLLKRPGWLTQEFMEGRRVRYVHPLRLFLFTSAVCLALLQWTHPIKANVGYGRRARSAAHPAPSPSPIPRQGEAREDDGDPAPSPTPAAATPAASLEGSALPAADAGVLAGLIQDTLKDARSGGKDRTLEQRWENFGDRIQKKVDDAGGMEKFNERMVTNVQQKLSWVALAMLPIFAVLMRWAFGRSGGYYFNYLVFSLHYHTFLLMFWVAYSFLQSCVHPFNAALWQIPGLLAGLGLLVPPWYLYRAFRQMYGQRPLVTAAKVCAVGGLHLLTIFIGLTMISATAFLS